MALAGGCRCESLRYTLDLPALPVTYACHCLTCQTMSGASFVLQALVPAARFHPEGAVVEWTHPDRRGKVTTQRFCAACKTRVYSTNEGRPGIVLLRAGTLDDSIGLTPAVHMWAKRRQAWIGLPAGAEAHAEAIPTERILAIFAPNFA